MKIIFAGGGTAGHINPALSIAQMFKAKNPHAEILFVGNKDSLEDKLVQKAGFDIAYIKVSSIKRSLSPENFKTAVNFVNSIKQCKKIIKEFGADAVVGTGGYVSGPAVYAAKKLGVRCFIHEQNAFPGITSKFLSRYADIAFLSFEGSEKYFKKAKKTVMTGNPLNESFMSKDKKNAREKLGIGENDFYVLSFAGSLGAKKVNELFVDFIVKNAEQKDFVHTHATGKFGYGWMPSLLAEKGFDVNEKSHIGVFEYIYDMPVRLAACDLVVCRAGAITLGEVMAMGKPSVIIPSPNVTGNHQYHNAMSLVSRNAALILEEKDATGEKLYSMVLDLKNDPDRLKSIGTEARKLAKLGAAEAIYNNIYSEIKK